MDDMVEPSCVISALRILVTPRQADKTDLKSVSRLQDVLVENISIFENRLKSEEQFHQLNITWTGDSTVNILPSDSSMWRFVLYCLKCLHLLQQALTDSVDVYDRSSHPAFKPTGAPKMSPDTLSVNEQKVVKTAVQFIVCMGICPRLQAGVGIPIELRSGFSHMVQRTEMENSATMNVQLFSCIKVLLSCTSLPLLGTLILTQHLTDILAVLFQLCHSETERKSTMNERAKYGAGKGENVLASSVNRMSIENSSPAQVVDMVRSQFEEKCQENTDQIDACTSRNNKGQIDSATNNQNNDQFDAATNNQNNDQFDAATNSHNTSMEKNTKFPHSDQRAGNLIVEDKSGQKADSLIVDTESDDDYRAHHVGDIFVDIDYCTNKLEELIKKVYPPLLVRTLMLLQGGPPKTKTKGVPAIQPAPKWLRQECSKYLVCIIMRPRGVQSIMRGMLDVPGAGKGMTGTHDWRKCEAVAKVISCCPLQSSVSSEMYYKSVGSQILDLIHIEDVQVCKQFLRVACSIISNMSTQHDVFTQTYIIQPILKPLLMCIDTSVFDVTVSDVVVVEESQLTKCIDDCKKVFIEGCGANPMLISYIQPVLLTLFDLFVFTSHSVLVSPVRTSCKQLLTSFLKQMDTHVAVTCLECMAYQQKSSKIELPRKHLNMKFTNGDSGGVIVVTDLSESNTGSDDIYVSCIVGLIEDLQTTDVAGQFLVHMLQELTKFINSEITGEDEIPHTPGNIEEAHVLLNIEERSQLAISNFHKKLTSLNLLAAICEKLGPSCITNAHHTIDFVKATLERGVQVCKNTEDVMFEAFENETVTMAIGLVTALMTGAFEMNEQDRKYMQELLPLLVELSRYHPDSSVKEMATDVRIAIATQGAVWSEITKEKCAKNKRDSEKKTTNKPNQSHQSKSVPRKIEEISSKPTVTQTIHDDANVATSQQTATFPSKVRDKVIHVKKSETKPEGLDEVMEDGQKREGILDNEKHSTSQQSSTDGQKTQTELDMAFTELLDPLIPVRGHGLIRLYRLVQKRDPVIKNKEELLLKIFEENLDHDDSYIYLSAVNGLTAMCDTHAALVVPRVCQQFADYRNKTDCSKHEKSPELRMKLGEIMVKASRCLGDLLPKYRDVLLPSILTGVKDGEAFVRASSLSNLGELCKLLRFSLGNIVHEVFDCCSNTLKYDENVEVRKAAAQALTLLLQGLGNHVFKVLESVLKDLYRVLKSVMLTEHNDGVKMHTQLALNELDDIMRAYLFPQQKLEKRIKVLDFD